MKRRFTTVVAAVCMMLAVPVLSQAGSSPVGKTFYTAVNIWYEDAQKIFTTNFHKGAVLPLNTKVTILKYRKSGFVFQDESGMEYKLIYAKKHSRKSWKEVFSDYFSEEKIDLGKFSAMERQNIEAGEIEVGMSKDAVLAAYGYPPSHMTPSLDGNAWKYWYSRAQNFFVYFDDEGRVKEIGDY